MTDEANKLVPPTHSRRLAESLVFLFVVILFLRVMVVEPYGVPTGSMAPTLLGNHKHLNCSLCGQRIDIGDNPHELRAVCPNCGERSQDYDDADAMLGDRLMVNKTVYSIRTPHRWEVAVFWCPSDYSKPYVKRVAGLPGEKIQIRDGDVWIDGQLARKTLAEARACAIPVWDYDHRPQGRDWSKHLRAKGDDFLRFEEYGIRVESPSETDEAQWSFRNWSFEKMRAEPLTDLLAYNNPRPGLSGQEVHDFLLEFDFELDEAKGRLECQLDDGEAKLLARFDFQSDGLTMKLFHRGKESLDLLREARCPVLKPGTHHRVAFALVDRRGSLSLDGAEWFGCFDLPPAGRRLPVLEPFAMRTKGFNGRISHLRLSRDIHYRATGENAIAQPLQLRRKQYFMLGDNSQNSDDSRAWQIPAVPEKNFLGKPFLLHQPGKIAYFSLGGSTYHYQTIDWSRFKWIH